MRKNFNSVQMLETSENCDKYSKSVSYETLVGGTTTIGTGIKQTRRLSKGSAIKPLTAVGTLTSLLHNSAKVMEKLLHRHSEPKENNPKKTGTVMPDLIGHLSRIKKEKEKLLHRHSEPKAKNPKNNIKYWILHFANASLRMTIPALAFLLSLNLSTAFAADCVPETTIINGVEKPLVTCYDSVMFKFTYDSSGNATNQTVYTSDNSGWEKFSDYIYTYDSSGNQESEVFYTCDSGNCEQVHEVKYKLDTAPDGTKIAKEIQYWCSNGVCEKNTESELVYAYNDDTFTGDGDSYGDYEYFCNDPNYECDMEFPQSVSATPFCPKGCNGCDVERACSSCAEGYKKIDTWCNKIRWTPAEAAEVLRDDNTNEVTITFKK